MNIGITELSKPDRNVKGYPSREVQEPLTQRISRFDNERVLELFAQEVIPYFH